MARVTIDLPASFRFSTDPAADPATNPQAGPAGGREVARGKLGILFYD